MIELQNVRKTYLMGDVKVHAICGIDLKIYKGEFVAIIGHSGSGKSTLMNIIGSLDLPTSGKVKLDGVDITTLNESELAQWRGRKIGFVFQSFNLIPTLTAIENVMLPLMFKNVSAEEAKERSRKMLERVGMGHRLNHLPKELSGGEQQRVAIARALVVEPEVILADEPTGNIDYKSGLEIIGLLKKLNKEDKRTVIVVTHERFVAEHADRIIELRDGKIIKDSKNHEFDFNEIKRK
ncbi:MAG: ABC transporter ATP-binding protein [Candidatus Micrarchaeota archaeon]|nr:ABC transporter ATP-binding protein [Candidatus Micrarchaeota archaeon]